MEDQPPQAGTNQGGNGHGGDQYRKHPGRLVAHIEIPHHGPRQYHVGAGTHGLNQAPSNHHRHTGGQGATGRTHDEQQQPKDDGQAAAITVAERPPKELADAEADQVAGNGQLHPAGIRMQGGPHGRQCRQVEVRGNGGEGHQGAQDGKHPEALPLNRARISGWRL